MTDGIYPIEGPAPEVPPVHSPALSEEQWRALRGLDLKSRGAVVRELLEHPDKVTMTAAAVIALQATDYRFTAEEVAELRRMADMAERRGIIHFGFNGAVRCEEGCTGSIGAGGKARGTDAAIWCEGVSTWSEG